MGAVQQELVRLEKLRFHENELKNRGFHLIAGVDEAGRGPLAGPVVAAACILPDDLYIEGVNDSKQLTPSQRYEIFAKLTENPLISYGIGIADSILIDQINILQATFHAMVAAIQALNIKPDYVLVDGSMVPPQLKLPSTAVVSGDSLSYSIAAASIIAKETRDRIMVDYHKKWPDYHFDEHKGYPTKKHIKALEKHGPCPIHRRSFEPLKTLFPVIRMPPSCMQTDFF